MSVICMATHSRGLAERFGTTFCYDAYLERSQLATSSLTLSQTSFKKFERLLPKIECIVQLLIKLHNLLQRLLRQHNKHQHLQQLQQHRHQAASTASQQAATMVKGAKMRLGKYCPSCQEMCGNAAKTCKYCKHVFLKAPGSSLRLFSFLLSLLFPSFSFFFLLPSMRIHV